MELLLYCNVDFGCGYCSCQWRCGSCEWDYLQLVLVSIVIVVIGGVCYFCQLISVCVLFILQNEIDWRWYMWCLLQVMVGERSGGGIIERCQNQDVVVERVCVMVCCDNGFLCVQKGVKFFQVRFFVDVLEIGEVYFL